jgi:hypothetical protein
VELSTIGLKSGHNSFSGIIEKNNLKGRNQLEDLRVDGRTTLKLVLKNVAEGVAWIHLSQKPVVGCCEHGSEPLALIKEGKRVSFLVAE